MAGINPESLSRDSNEAQASVKQLNNTVDEIKDLSTAINEKRISNEQGIQRVTALINSMMVRLNSMASLSTTNPQMVPALGQAISVFNRLVSLTGNDPKISQARDQLMQLVESKTVSLQNFGEQNIAKIETDKNLTVARVEAEFNNFSGSPKDFFENPKYRTLATAVHGNFMPLNPESTEKAKEIVKAYYELNSIKIPSTDFKVAPTTNAGRSGFMILEKNPSGVYVPNKQSAMIE